jgi:hypothetical protein
VHLQQRVDPGEEEDGLDHHRLLLLQAMPRARACVRQRSS